jgi:hypothetical protein
MAEKIMFAGTSSSSNPGGIYEVSGNQPLPTFDSIGQNLASKSVTFTGAATLGAIGATTRFTVSGVVKMRIFAVCSSDLVGATATISVGVTSNTAALIALTTATTIDNGHIWNDASPVIGVDALTAFPEQIVTASVVETIATAAITGGVLTYYCLWTPVSSGATVTAV